MLAQLDSAGLLHLVTGHWWIQVLQKHSVKDREGKVDMRSVQGAFTFGGEEERRRVKRILGIRDLPKGGQRTGQSTAAKS